MFDHAKMTSTLGTFMALDTLFGELRSLLSRKTFDHASRDILIDLVQAATRQDLEGYRQKWLPYIQGQRIDWPTPFATLRDPETLSLWAEMLPFATFALDLQRSEVSWDQRARGDGEHPFGLPMAQIVDLRLDSCSTNTRTLTMLFNATGMRHVRELSFDALRFDPRSGFTLELEKFEALCSARYLTNLEHLSLRRNNIHGNHVRSLTRSRAMHSLEALVMNDNALGNHGLRELVTSEQATSLRVLALAANNITDLTSLATQATCTALESLSLDHNQIGARGAEMLAGGRLQNLDELSLASCHLDASGLRHLANSTTLRPPRMLDLSNNRITHDALLHFAQSDWTKNLTRLDVSNNDLDERGFAPLVGSRLLANLEALGASSRGQVTMPLGTTVELLEQLDPARITTLNLSGATIGEDGASIIAEMHALKSLKLNGAYVTDEGVEALASSEHLRSLESLELNNNNLTDRGAKALANSKTLAHLRDLSLYGNQIGDDGMIAFAQDDSLPHLEFLNMTWNRVGERAAKALLESEAIRRLHNLYLVANPLGHGRAVELERALSPHMAIHCVERIG